MKSIILHHELTAIIILFNGCFWKGLFSLSTFHLNVILKLEGTLLSKVSGDVLGCLGSRDRVTWCALFSRGRQFFSHLEVRRESDRTVYTCQHQKSHINPREAGGVGSGCSQKTQEWSSRLMGGEQGTWAAQHQECRKAWFRSFAFTLLSHLAGELLTPTLITLKTTKED